MQIVDTCDAHCFFGVEEILSYTKRYCLYVGVLRNSLLIWAFSSTYTRKTI